MNKKRKKKTNKEKIYTATFIILALIFFTFYIAPWNFITEIRYDKKWPYQDQTSGSYSGDYDGIDISRHQGKIRWDELKKNTHIQFIYIKATEGLTLNDPCYEENIKNARKHGFKVGSYHFLSKGSLGELQFLHFYHAINKSKQDLRPVIDVEDDGTFGWSRSQIQSHLKGFIRACEMIYGVQPIIYCSASYYKDYLSPEFDEYLHFIASYSGKPVLPGEPTYDIWQFSRKGRIPGIWNWVDLNRFAEGMNVEEILWHK